ncbi:MAG: APC family permease [Candidatus Margulisbacteria bacterium]|nr:APC family permease [Candidatus Margulisiibacteriota bacterium]
MERKKVLGFWDLLLFSFCAIFGVEAIATVAAIGPTAISWWLILIVGYFLPFGLIAAELGATYPEQGGMYAWVKRAFGDKWAARTTWYYWIALPIWIPAIYIACAEIIGWMFFPGLTLEWQVLIGIAMIWLTVGINLCPLQWSKWIVNAGSFTKLVVIAGMFLAAAAFFFQHGHLANQIDLANLLPNFNAAVIFIPIIMYNLLGCELISGAAGEMKDPKRDVPRAVIFSALAIASLYLVATLLIWTVVPAAEISVSSGLVQMFGIAFNNHPLSGIINICLGAFILATLFSGVVAWTLGENRVLAEAAENGEMPKIFGAVTRQGVPIGAAVLSGIVSTVVIVVYWFFADNAAEMFWSVTAFCLVVDLFAYLILFPAYIILRVKDKKSARPYQVPGPDWFAVLLAIMAEAFVLLAVVILSLQPGKDFVWTALPTIGGALISIAIGEWLIRYSFKAKKNGNLAVGR